MMKFFIEIIKERAISPYINMIATVFLALGMGIAMAQEDNLGLSPANRNVTATAGSTTFSVITNLAEDEIFVDRDTWTEATANAAWPGRRWHTSVVFDGKMWVIGGDDGARLNDVWSSTDGINWTEVTDDAAWSARAFHTSVVFDNKMWVIGGRDGSNKNDVWSSTDGINWTQVTAAAGWSARTSHASVVFDGKMWVIGGSDGSQKNDVWNSTDGITWTQIITNAAWSGRTNHTSVVYDNKMWVIGGVIDVWSSTDGINWMQATATAGWSRRFDHTSVVFDNKMWVIGGTDSGDHNDVWHSTDGAAWTRASRSVSSWSARANHTSVVFDNKMWVIGGTARTDRLNDVYFSQGDWLSVSRSGTTITADYEANGIVAVPRTGNITVSRITESGDLDLTTVATVTQAGIPPVLDLDLTNQDVTVAAGSTTFMVTTNLSSDVITTTDDADWLRVWSLSGTTLTIDYEVNSMAAPRTGTVSILGGGLTKTVTVTQEGAAPELSLSDATKNVTAETGNADIIFTVTTNIPLGDLTITDDADWLDVKPSGTTLTADYEANSIAAPRAGTVTVSGQGVTVMATVIQAGATPELSLSSATQSVTSEAGSTDFTVMTNVPSGDLTITDDTDWLTVSLSGTTLTIDYEANGGTGPRTGTITISGGGLTQTVPVVQAEAGVTFELALSPAVQNVTAEAGSTDFMVTTNLPSDAFIITDDADWLTVSLSGATLTADYEANSDTSPRTGTLTILGGGLTQTVTVVQAEAGVTFELALSPATQSVTGEAASIDFMVTTNLTSSDALTITDNADWLTVSLSGTSSPYTLTADYEANIDTGPRTGTITVSGGGLTETVTVTQTEVDPELAVSPAMQSVTAEAGSTDFAVTTNIPERELTGVTMSEGEWTEATDNAPWSARDSHTSVAFDNRMWVIGGLNGSTHQNDVWSSTNGINWTQATADAPWSARRNHTSVVFDNKMWVIGGDDGDEENDVWSSTDGITWTQATADAPWSRSHHTSVVFANKMWVIGGYDGSHQNDVWSSTDGINWTQTAADAGWSARTNHTSVVFDNKMWVIGGVDGPDALNDVWYSTDGITWTRATAAADWSIRNSHTSVVFNNMMWIIGGWDGSFGRTAPPIYNDVWSSTDGITWTQDAADVPWSERSDHTSVVFDDDLWVIGGYDGTNELNDVFFFGSWLTASLSDTKLTVNYSANGIAAPRKGTITVLGGELIQTVTVTQAGAVPELALSPATQDVTAEAGSTDFTVTTNVLSDDLTITADADWLTLDLVGTTLTADYEANSSISSRTGTITVSGGEPTQTETVTVTQKGAVPELAVSPATQSVTAEAGRTDFMVTTNVPSGDLTITADADWLKASLSGTTLTADYDPNSSISPRTGTITISGGELIQTVTVTQAGAAPELSLSPATQSVTIEAGTTDFMVTTNVPSDALTITDDADWLTTELSGSSSPYTLTATYEANEGTDPRMGTVTVSGGGLMETVMVEQEDPLGLEDETALVVYPNPGSAQVTVDFGDMDQGEGKAWMLFDPSGRKALSGSVARGETTLVIHTQGLLSGLYLFQVRGEGQKSYVSHRVVIRH